MQLTRTTKDKVCYEALQLKIVPRNFCSNMKRLSNKGSLHFGC